VSVPRRVAITATAVSSARPARRSAASAPWFSAAQPPSAPPAASPAAMPLPSQANASVSAPGGASPLVRPNAAAKLDAIAQGAPANLNGWH
jgi:hypothetical protein